MADQTKIQWAKGVSGSMNQDKLMEMMNAGLLATQELLQEIGVAGMTTLQRGGKVYKGTRLYAPTALENGEIESEKHVASGCRVEVLMAGRERRELDPRHDLRLHSEQFNWGYAGSGPAQLALALCCDAIGEEIGKQAYCYKKFKNEVVSRWPQDADFAWPDWYIRNWWEGNDASWFAFPL